MSLIYGDVWLFHQEGGHKVSLREHITSLSIRDGKQTQLRGQLVH